MPDVFGYKKTAKGLEGITSPSMVVVSISDEKLRLAQTVNVAYQRTVNPVYELGSDSVWMAGAHSQGTVTINRAVGETPLLKPFAQDDPCKPITILIGKGDAACGTEPGTVTASGALLTSIGVDLNVGSVNITDTATYTCGAVSIE